MTSTKPLETELDNLIWTALTGEQARFALGTGQARRFRPDIGPLAAVQDLSPESLADLGALVRETGSLGLLHQDAVPDDVPGAELVHSAEGVRMIYRGGPIVVPDNAKIEPLSARDYPDMLELATLTAPGPFAARTGDLGGFCGVRDAQGKLLAMAGQRLRTTSYVEVSGVCTHPDARGRGLAARLMTTVMAAIQADGCTPILHSYADNVRAIALYERLGFVMERRVSLTIFAPRT
ncbi:GCN5-like N-acetyltransferase [Novosphingobium sp. Rr 2-17]|uniref:GNAT family N-acetyltransferase n=1 Tax=Novosphingobium sp. Rr 2-17 TaxID=555793 RepID=UPI0002698534|nr:GNAT family N-acetyltransferase [Novosphingobium sp. Rr 2-17]EIZ78556.1 GCN5-like N-acetyltransferase [Novosphingobium sp. Rr 2-17]